MLGAKIIGIVCKIKIQTASARPVRKKPSGGSHTPLDRKGKPGSSRNYPRGVRSKTSWQLERGFNPQLKEFEVREGDSYPAMEESASQTHVLKIRER